MAAGNVFTHLRGILIFIPWACELILMDLILSALLPVSYFFPNWVYDVSSFVAFTCWYSIQMIFEVLNSGKITKSGDVLPKGESAIVIANHLSWTDFYMIQSLAVQAGMLGRCRWFSKIELRRVPLLGWGIWAMGMPMVSRKWMQDKKELDRVFSGITDREWPTCRSAHRSRLQALTSNRAHQLQRGYSLYPPEIRRNESMVQGKWPATTKTPLISSYEGVPHYGPTFEKG